MSGINQSKSEFEMSEPDLEKQSITKMLRAWSNGNQKALDALMPLVHTELRKQAHSYLRRERRGHTLQTTALINEAYLKLIDQQDVEWESRTHFFAIAAQAMRRVLVDYARKKQRKKRGGDAVKITLEEKMLASDEEKTVDLIALDEALTRLEEIDPHHVQVIELRYFSGLTLEETAQALDISRATVAREWSFARAWLRRELTR